MVKQIIFEIFKTQIGHKAALSSLRFKYSGHEFNDFETVLKRSPLSDLPRMVHCDPEHSISVCSHLSHISH